ncbi:amidohydrolase family protein [Streptomyces sp. NPDC087263]|uniref:amidohydrolase family protein n=1 Tax=Streptomyces sp. NPDC087263 TaxID=3365773 RepID=UPI003808F08B
MHQHVIPPRYQAFLDGRGISTGGLAPVWSEDLALKAMDAHGVGTGIVSLSVPGVLLGGGDAEARSLACLVNEFGADLASRRSDRFGVFATVTLPDVVDRMTEAAHALDNLGAEGVVLSVNAEGAYLGDPRFAPLLAELDRRHAVVYIHPSHLEGPAAEGIPPYVADYLLDTTPTVVSLVRGGAVRRRPNITFILSHGGGFVPFAAHRLAMTMSYDSDRTVEELLADLKTFHVETAQAANPVALSSILGFFGADHVLWGASSSPWTTPSSATRACSHFEQANLPQESKNKIAHENAERLLRL